uniref:uncharacterized protein LOC101307934 n=1 Tax=Fragaria vesca subsp. vesca TaxID=101020 RepID=UPI0005C981FE|nr:PREDICTED: uncharacterized protein LOC101307934 [Fragaria vesca subsp. vesca]
MFPLNPQHLPKSLSSLFSAYASFTAFKFLLQSLVNELKHFIPPWVRSYIYSKLRKYFFKSRPNDNLTLVINKVIGMELNEAYDKVEVYLGAKISPSDSRLELSKTNRQKSVSLAIEKRGQVITDTFDDIELRWRYVSKLSKNTCTTKDRHPGAVDGYAEEKCQWSFELTFDKKHRDKVIDSYMPYMLAQAESIKQGERVLKLHSTGRDPYGSPKKSCIDLVHPATFETMAMDPEVKEMIIDDLDRFVKRREFYKKVGKAWKRGYLLYGPPGTGKSSLIAAMANYLKFDVYDLELTSVYDNSELRRVLLSTSNRSILVVEDIDCSVQIKSRESAQPSKSSASKFTLSGLLNFIDGLWSCCGDERIIVFTTNHKERLDPALFRPGRMDLHIHLSYCTPSGFRILASNYLGIHESSPHHLFGEIESLIKITEVTPAAIAEELMKNDDADVVLEGLVRFLKEKKAADDKDLHPNTLILLFNPNTMFASNPTMFSAYASFAASMMLLRSITDQLIPAPLQTYIYSFLRRLFTPLSTTLTLVIDEHTGLIARNEVFDAAELYLRTKTSSLTNRLRVCKTPKKKTISSAIDKNQELVDTFENMKLTWQFVCIEPTKGGTYSYEKRHYELSFHKKHKEKVMECYLPYVLATAKAIKEKEKVLKLYTLDRDENSRGSGLWKSIGLEHPSTFDTVAMEPDMKKRIVGDLDRFVRRKEFYKKVGKAWKRGYLLYGPPGTGKSSLIAAMANYLKFSIFDLELSSLSTNCELRKALLSTSNRSILVIEDIDCSVEIQNREAGEGASKNNKSNKQWRI